MDPKTNTRTTPAAVDLSSGDLLATPRTDAEAWMPNAEINPECVTADFARELERENARLLKCSMYFERRVNEYRNRFGFQPDIEDPKRDLG